MPFVGMLGVAPDRDVTTSLGSQGEWDGNLDIRDSCTATVHLMDWLIAEYGFTPTDAYCLVSTCPCFRIKVYQMCKLSNLSFVAGAELPKRYIVA